MDFNLLLADLRTAAQQYCQKISDKYAATVAYCEVACKTIDKLESIENYENKVIGLWIILGYIGEMYARLTGNIINALCQKLFRHCARTVLNIQWQQLADDSQSKQNFRSTLENFHAKLSALNNTRFSLILDLMETGWTHPTLGLVMAEEEDNEEEECLTYIKNEDPVILKIRVEIMIQENCEEFALNLCSWCLKHPALKNDLDIRQTQLMLLHKLNQQDRLQEECQKIPCHDGVRLISRLQQTDNNKALCTELAQTFLIQDWIRPSDHCNSKDLLTLWIRHQYQADRDQEQFLSSVWAVAKLSRSTEQIGLIIDGLREECGDMFLQLYTDLCIFAINYDKSCLEKHMQEGDMEGLRARQQAMASTSEKLSQLYTTRNPKTAMYAAVTAFALNPNQATLSAVKSFYVNQSLSLVKDRGKQCCTNCINKTGQCDHAEKGGKINPATFFEVERLLNMLRPYYLNPDHDWLSLGPACEKYLAEREAVTQNYSNEDLINDNSSVSEGSIPELDQSGMSPQVSNSQRTLLHQHLVRPMSTNTSGYSEQITQVSKHLKPFTPVTSGANPASRSQTQDATSSISGIEPTLQLSDAELGDKHTLIKQLLFTDLSLADANTLNELIQQGNIDVMPEAFQEITIDNTGSVSGSGNESQDIPVPIPSHMKHSAPVSAADPLFSSLNIPVENVTPINSQPASYHQRIQPSVTLQQPAVSKIALPGHTVKNVQSQFDPKPPSKIVPTPATVTSHNVKSAVMSVHQNAGQLNNKLTATSSQPTANVQLKPSTTKSSVGSAVFHITSGLLRVPSQPDVVPAPQDQTVVLQNQPQAITNMPVQQLAVTYPTGQVTSQPATQTQYYTNFPQTVSQHIVQHQVPVAVNLIGSSQVSTGVQQVAVPLQQQTPMTSNILPTTMSTHGTSTVANIAPSLAAQLTQSMKSQGNVSVAVMSQQMCPTVVSTALNQQSQQIKTQHVQKSQHLGKPQLAGLAQNRLQRIDPTKGNQVANIQQMLKLGTKSTVGTQDTKSDANVTYMSTNHPHVALKTKSQTYPLVKKKSEIIGKTLATGKPITAHVPSETDSNVPFVLKSNLSKPKPKPKSKATIFTNSMMNTKLSTNTALLGGNGNQSVTCVKPLLASGSTVCKPDTLPVYNAAQAVADTSAEEKHARNEQSTIPASVHKPNISQSSCSTDPNTNRVVTGSTVVSTSVVAEKPKKASKKLFNVFYRCNICNLLVVSLDELRKHIQTVCRADEFAPILSNVETVSDPNKSSKSSSLNPKLTIKSLEACRVYQCPVCKVYCVTDPEVLQHRTVCLKSRCRPRKKPEKPKPVSNEASEVSRSDSATSTSESSIVSEMVLNEIVQTVEEKLPGLPASVGAAPAPAPAPPPPPPQPEVPPLDLSSLDLTNTEDLKKFIEHFKQQEMLKEKNQPTSKSSKKTKKVEVPTAVVSVMSGVVDNVEANTAALPEAATPKSTSETLSTAPSPPSANTIVTSSPLMPSATEPQPGKSKPKVSKPKRVPNPKFKELFHHGMSYFKCFLCKQTFCRKDTLEDHWPECYERNGPIRKPKKLTEKPSGSVSSSTGAVNVPAATENSVSTSVSIPESYISSGSCTVTTIAVPTLASTVNSTGSELSSGVPLLCDVSSNVSTDLNPSNKPETGKLSVANASNKAKGNTPKASPSKPKPPPQSLDSRELAKYEDAIQAVIDSTSNNCSGKAPTEQKTQLGNNLTTRLEQVGQTSENITLQKNTGGSATEMTPKKKKKTKPSATPGSIVNGEGTLVPAYPPSETVPKKKKKPKPTPLAGSGENKGEGLLPSTESSSENIVPKKKKKPKPASVPTGGDSSEANKEATNSTTATEGNQEQSDTVLKKKKKKKKTDNFSSESVFETTGTPSDQPSPKKRNKPIPKKKHVNVKQMLKDRLECILSGKKDQCDVRSDGVSVPLSQRTKGRPKPQILSETKQVIIIVGLEWGCGCSPCGTLFRNHRNLIQHLVIKHLHPYTNKKGGTTTCHLCQQQFPSFISYLNHTPQHSEIILERMDALIEEKGEPVDVEKSPEKEDSEENYVPFPDIQEALNDMLKIRQQQTHGEDGLKLGTESVGDVNLLSPSSDPSSGFQQGTLPASMSLDSLHEFLPDPSKENVDELAAFARMINDPSSLNTDITSRISEQESFTNDGQREKIPVELPVIPVSIRDEINTAGQEVGGAHIPSEISIDSQPNQHPSNQTEVSVVPNPNDISEVENKVEMECEEQQELHLTRSSENLCDASEQMLCEQPKEINPVFSVSADNEKVGENLSVDEEKERMKDVESEVCSEVLEQKLIQPSEVDTVTINSELEKDKPESVSAVNGGVESSSVADITESLEISLEKEIESVIDDNQQLIVSEQETENEVKNLRSNERNVEPEEKTENELDKSEGVEDNPQPEECEQECQITVKHLRSHPRKVEITEKIETQAVEASDSPENVPDIKSLTVVDEVKLKESHVKEVPENAAEDAVKCEEVVTPSCELKAIVKHLRSHPKKAELVGKNGSELERKSVVKVKETKNKIATEREAANTNKPKRTLRKTPKKSHGQATDMKEKGDLEHSVSKHDKTSVSQKRRVHHRKVEDSDRTEPDRVYRLRKTIPAKQFYRSSLKMKARMARSSILDVLHGNRKLNVMRARGRHSVDSRVEKNSSKQTDESKALIKRTAARAHSAKFVTRSSARQMEQRTDDEKSKCAQLPESPNKEQNVSMRTRATIKKNKFGLKSFEVRLNNMSAETVRRKSAELARSTSPATTVNRRSSCDTEVKSSTQVSRRVSCDDKILQAPALKPNPTSPSFLDSFLSYLNTRTEDDDPFQKKKLPKKRSKCEQMSTMNKTSVVPEVASCDIKVLETESSHSQSSEIQSENDLVSESSVCASAQISRITGDTNITISEQNQVSLPTNEEADCVGTPSEEANCAGTPSEGAVSDICKKPEDNVTNQEKSQEFNKEITVESKTENELVKEKIYESEDNLEEQDRSKPETDFEEDEVILLEEFRSGDRNVSPTISQESPVKAVQLTSNKLQASRTVYESESVNEPDMEKVCASSERTVVPSTVKVSTADKEKRNCEDDSSVCIPKPDCMADKSDNLTECATSIQTNIENVTVTDSESFSSVTTSTNIASAAGPADLKTVTAEVADSPEETPPREDKLKGVKSLREKVKTEPFTWDVDDEEDQKLAERNERSLKALREQVSIAPFTWDLEEDEHGHVITGIEQVQIAPVASCSVTRNTRSGRRRIVKLSTDSRDSGGSTDSDKKEGSIECEATLTTVTWNVEVDDNAIDDLVLSDNISPGSNILKSDPKCPLPGVLGRAALVKDSINCIRVVPTNSLKRKLPDVDTKDGNQKKPLIKISSSENSTVESTAVVSDTQGEENGDCRTNVTEPSVVDNDSAVIPDSNDNQNGGKSNKKAESKTSSKASPVSKEMAKQEKEKGSVIMTRKAAKAAAVGQPPNKRARTCSTAVSNHLPAMVRRSAKAVKYSSKYKSNNRNNPPPRVQVIRVDPVLEGVTTRRTRHGSSERTVHTPVAAESMQHDSGTKSDHKWTINKRKNFAYQFSRARRDKKSY